MAREGSDWVDPDTHGWVRRPATDGDWAELVDDYGGDSELSGPFQRVVEVVRENECVSVVIENRYVDADYRSEFAAFWAPRFADRSPFARRLHFFAADVDDENIHALPHEVREAYLGYAVCRPVELGAVGRTVLRWPKSLDGSVLAHIDDEVSLFGNRLTVRGAPFCQQDTEFLRCAHAAAWVCHYTAYRRGLVGRHLTAAFAHSAPGLLSPHRALPSKGLTPHQVQAIFAAMGQPAVMLDINGLPRVQGVPNPTPLSDSDGNRLPGGLWDSRIFSIICRYLNSGFPVFIGTADHAFTVVGWKRDGAHVRFVVNDDARGPYLRIDSPLDDVPRRPWQLMMVPMPPKVYLGAEGAENAGYTTLSVLGAATGASASMTSLSVNVANGDVALRTLLLDGNHYKDKLRQRGVDAETVRLLSLARLPHYVWVVEAHDVMKCAADEPCVIAEVVFDSTSHDARPRKDALLGPGFASTFPPGGAPATITTSVPNWRSHLEELGAAH
jgi:hypothetical protein